MDRLSDACTNQMNDGSLGGNARHNYLHPPFTSVYCVNLAYFLTH